MNDSEKFDLSLLDPAADAARWERIVQSVTRRTLDVAGRQRLTLTSQLVAWARPALGFAAAAAVISWVGVATLGAGDDLQRIQGEQAASVLARWAARDERPSALSILEVLGSER